MNFSETRITGIRIVSHGLDIHGRDVHALFDVEYNGTIVVAGCKYIVTSGDRDSGGDGRKEIYMFPGIDNTDACPSCSALNPFWKKRCHSCSHSLASLDYRAGGEQFGMQVVKQTEYHHPMSRRARDEIVDAFTLARDGADADGHDWESCSSFLDGDIARTFDPSEETLEDGRIAEASSPIFPNEVWLQRVHDSDDGVIANVCLKLSNNFLIRCCTLKGNHDQRESWVLTESKRPAPRVCFECDHVNEHWRAKCDDCRVPMSDSNISYSAHHAWYRETMRFTNDSTKAQIQEVVAGAYEYACVDRGRDVASVDITDDGRPTWANHSVHYNEPFSQRILFKPERRRHRRG